MIIDKIVQCVCLHMYMYQGFFKHNLKSFSSKICGKREGKMKACLIAGEVKHGLRSLLPRPGFFHQIAGMAQWQEHSPPTNVARVQFLVSAVYMG